MKAWRYPSHHPFGPHLSNNGGEKFLAKSFVRVVIIFVGDFFSLFVSNEKLSTTTTTNQVLLTERFDEGLALLQRMLQWDPIDMTYCKMLQTKKGERRWDGKPLQNVPKISDLAPEVSHRRRRHPLVSTWENQGGWRGVAGVSSPPGIGGGRSRHKGGWAKSPFELERGRKKHARAMGVYCCEMVLRVSWRATAWAAGRGG